MSATIPYAGKERFSWPSPKDKRTIPQRPKDRRRHGRKQVGAIAFNVAIYNEIVAIGRAGNCSAAEVVRALVSLGLEHIDGVKRPR